MCPEENEFHQRQPLLSQETEEPEQLKGPPVGLRNGAAVRIEIDPTQPPEKTDTKFPIEK
jgi:hypothetical protein